MIWFLLLFLFPLLILIAKFTQTPTIKEQEEHDRVTALVEKDYYGALAKAWEEEYERLKETE